MQQFSTSRSLTKGEKLNLAVPVSSVPALRCAYGAQCSPLRTQIPRSLSFSASASQLIHPLLTEITPLCVPVAP